MKYSENQKSHALNLALNTRQRGECPFKLATKILEFLNPASSKQLRNISGKQQVPSQGLTSRKYRSRK